MKTFFLVIAIWVIAVSPVRADQKSVEMTATVPAHQWKTTRLQNVNQGTTLNFEVTSDGDITVMLLDREGYERYPNVTAPLFRSVATNQARFTIIAPGQGDYFLVVENSKGERMRHYTVHIQTRLDVTQWHREAPPIHTWQRPIHHAAETLGQAFLEEPRRTRLGALTRVPVEAWDGVRQPRDS